jgi:SAM-dependent methyltransferase
MDDQFKNDLNRFSDLNFESFKSLALDSSLTKYQKIGFPDAYRAGQEQIIFQDITNKLSNLDKQNQHVLDIGSGCSELPYLLAKKCSAQNHVLFVMDSEEMLSQLDFGDQEVMKISGKFPQTPEFLDTSKNKFDVILIYSLAHYVFLDGGLTQFLDAAVSLLRPSGQLLLGDIPNVSKRKRFFASLAGVEFHKKFMQTDQAPITQAYEISENKIDDGIMLALFQRYRNFGFETYVLPLKPELVLANRREDLLIVRP